MSSTPSRDLILPCAMILMFGGFSYLCWQEYHPLLRLRAGGVETRAEIFDIKEAKLSDDSTWHCRYRFHVLTLEKKLPQTGEVVYFVQPVRHSEIDVLYLPDDPAVTAAKSDCYGKDFVLVTIAMVVLSLMTLFFIWMLLEVLGVWRLFRDTKPAL
jgi:hypothetical protein